VSAAEQVYYAGFDVDFFKLPPNIQARIESRIDQMDLRLGQFPHYHLTGSNRYGLRVGDYRIVNTFDVAQNKFTYWRWAIDERFTVRSDQRNGSD